MVERFPETVRVIHEPTQGNSSARNRGIIESRGKYIAFLDDDDKMHPDRLERQLELAERRPDASIIYGLIDVCSFDGSHIPILGLKPSVEFFVKPIMQDHPRYKEDPPLLILPSVMFFLKEHAIKVGLFDVRFNPFHTEDTDFCFRMWHLGPFLGVEQSVSFFRQASVQSFAKKRKGMLNWFQVRKNQNLFLQKMAQQYLARDNARIHNGFRKAQAQLLRETAHDLLLYPDGRNIARQMLQRAIQARPSDFKNWKWFLRTFYPNKSLLKLLKQKPQQTSLSDDIGDLSVLDSLYELPFDKKS